MSFFYSDNPIRDFENHEAEQERKLAKLPKCARCKDKEPIQDDYYYEVYGEILCEDHMNELYRRDTDSFVNS